MSETYFFLLYKAVTGMEFLFYTLCMAGFFYPFLKEGKNPFGLRRNLLLIILFNGAGYLLFQLPGFSGRMHMVVVTLALMAVSPLLGLERNFIFLLDAVFYCIRNLSMMLLQSVDYYLDKILMKNALTPERVFLNAFLIRILVTILHLLLFSVLLRTAGRQLRKKELRLHARELCYLLLTPATGILFVNIVLRLLVVANGSEIFRLFDSFPAFTVVIPAAVALFYAGILAAIAACQRILALQEERETYYAARQQLAAMQTRILEAERFQDDLRRIKHELKNHLTTIKGLAANGHSEEMEAYISQIDQSLNAFEITIPTGNPVTDVIINDKRKAATARGIDFQVHFSYPETGGYNAYDMGIILGNLLQNALEACSKVTEGPGYITLSGRRKNKFFLIQVRNSFQGEIRFHPDTALPLSTKEEDPPGISGHSHGIGLSNVKRTAEKYGGNLEIRTEDNTFCASVLLQDCPDESC